MALRVGKKKEEKDKKKAAPEKEEKNDAPSKDKRDSAPKTVAPPPDNAPVDMSGGAELPPDMSEDPSVAPEEMDMAPEGMEQAPQSAGVLDPAAAGYKGPEMGPFMCANCVYFSQDQPNTCAVVAGYIDDEGLCNVFTPVPQQQEQETPMEDMSEGGVEEMPQEMPEEEPPAM